MHRFPEPWAISHLVVFRPAIPFVQYNFGHLPSFSRDLQQARPSSRNLSPCFSSPQVPPKRCHCVLAIGTFAFLGLRLLCVSVWQSAQQCGHLVCWNRRSVETHTRFIPFSVNWAHSWILSSLPSIALSEVRLGSYIASAVFAFI